MAHLHIVQLIINGIESQIKNIEMKKLLCALFILPLLTYGQSGLPDMSRIMVSTGAPAGSMSVTGTFITFSTSTTAESATQTLTLDGTLLTTSIHVVPDFPLVVSTDNSTFTSGLFVTLTGGRPTGRPVMLYFKVPSGSPVTNATLNIVFTSSPATPVTKSAVVIVTSSASLSASPLTLNHTSVSGVQGPSQFTTLSGSGLGTNPASVPIPSNYVASLDNNIFTSTSPLTITPSGGNISQQIFFAIASGASPGAHNATSVITDAGASVSNITLTLNGTTSGGGLDTVAKFAPSLSLAAIPTWTPILGNPHQGVITATDNRSGSAITLASIGTDINHWGPLSNTTASNNGGDTTAANPVPNKVAIGYWFTEPAIQPWAGYNASLNNLSISGLTVGKHYTLIFFENRLGSAVPQTHRYTQMYVVDNVGVDSITSVGGIASPGLDVKANRTQVSFSGKTPNSSGIIYLECSPPVGGNSTNGYLFGYVGPFIIIQED